MNCPSCGDINAIELFTSVQCSTSNCQHYSQTHATETIMKNFGYRGTVTGRFSSKMPNFSNLPSVSTLQNILLSTQEENKRLRKDNARLAETIRKIETC